MSDISLTIGEQPIQIAIVETPVAVTVDNTSVDVTLEDAPVNLSVEDKPVALTVGSDALAAIAVDAARRAQQAADEATGAVDGLTLTGLSDTSISETAEEDMLVYRNGKWKNIPKDDLGISGEGGYVFSPAPPTDTHKAWYQDLRH